MQEITSQTILIVDDCPRTLPFSANCCSRYIWCVPPIPARKHCASPAPCPSRPDFAGCDDAGNGRLSNLSSNCVRFRHLRHPGHIRDRYGLYGSRVARAGMGAVDYITKPIVPPIMLARVHTQLELKQAATGCATRTAFWKPKSRSECRKRVDPGSIHPGLGSPGGDARPGNRQPHPAHPGLCPPSLPCCSSRIRDLRRY